MPLLSVCVGVGPLCVYYLLAVKLNSIDPSAQHTFKASPVASACVAPRSCVMLTDFRLSFNLIFAGMEKVVDDDFQPGLLVCFFCVHGVRRYTPS
ncbi:hypothetical protein B0H16DRAFT_1502854 [Mycena metata]|uniref:Uncharacterized protein n=1 Tax=Mycena metata TaxID=1033252 RepID=A0AAD7NW04_9AGAR|nr:hypothetical protein B0H16DRAFT_1502854 [Mycena metata]